MEQTADLQTDHDNQLTAGIVSAQNQMIEQQALGDSFAVKHLNAQARGAASSNSIGRDKAYAEVNTLRKQIYAAEIQISQIKQELEALQ